MHPTLRDLAFTAADLDRRAELRGSPEVITGLRGHPDAVAVVLTPEGMAVAPDQPVTLAWRASDAHACARADSVEIFLGLLDSTPVFARRGDDAPHGVIGLRELPDRACPEQATWSATAAALFAWHDRTRCCSRCGGHHEVSAAGWQLECARCSARAFPRLDPAVIMTIIDDDDRLLLGQGKDWDTDRWSTLAGFCEPGESLEGAVRREAYEESGVHIAEVTYVGSQPWPFPGSLMCGFTARARSTQIECRDDELRRATWFTRDEYAAGLRDGSVRKGGAVSISRRLIEAWFGKNLDEVVPF